MLEKTRENPSLLNNPLLSIWDQVKIIFFFKRQTKIEVKSIKKIKKSSKPRLTWLTGNPGQPHKKRRKKIIKHKAQ
jgi:hypothetical protein